MLTAASYTELYTFFSSTSFFFSFRLICLFVYLLITSDESIFSSLGPLPEVLVCFTTALHSIVDHFLTVIRLTTPLTSTRSPAGWLAVVDAMMDFLHFFNTCVYVCLCFKASPLPFSASADANSPIRCHRSALLFSTWMLRLSRLHLPTIGAGNKHICAQGII